MKTTEVHRRHGFSRRWVRTALRSSVSAMVLLACGAAAAATADNTQTASMDDLADLSIEELGNIKITSVSKKAEPLSGAAAAVYVITHNDVMRSGARSLPEILRQAPNLQVAQINASSYAITARGFNGPAADKLLVLIDGRSVYTPFYSGVQWGLQEVEPETIERIEVISGPGGTLWGANAVNGVINIITRDSSDAQGGVLHLGGGTKEGRGSLTYGGRLSEDVSYRASVAGFYRGHSVLASGANAADDWRKVQGSFRLDWTPDEDLITLQGDLYRGAEEQLTTAADQKLRGQNILARWNHSMGDAGELRIQGYYDHTGLSTVGVAANYTDTFDIDVQHSFSWGGRHDILWGGGYRAVLDDFPTVITGTQQVSFIPQRRTLTLANVFVQDTIALSDSVKMTPGVKLEDEPYTGVEVLPSVRLSWKVTEADLLWGAVSRAIRSPSRLDRDVTQRNGNTVTIAGGNFQPVEVIAYEIGYRTQIASSVSLSASGFYNEYNGLRSAEFTNGGFPLVFGNGMDGDTYGVELWGNTQVQPWWLVSLGFNWLHKDLRFKPGSSGAGGLQIAGNDPHYQFSARSSMNLGQNVTLDLDFRYVDNLPAPVSPAYAELGARVGWTVTDYLDVSLTGANLLHAHHAEFGTTPNTLQVGRVGVRVGRSFFLDTRWKF